MIEQGQQNTSPFISSDISGFPLWNLLETGDSMRNANRSQVIQVSASRKLTWEKLVEPSLNHSYTIHEYEKCID